MGKAIAVGFILAFLISFTMVFDSTIDRVYPEAQKDGLGTIYGLDSQESQGFPMRNMVLFFVYAVVGLMLVIVGTHALDTPLLANLFAWTGFSLLLSGFYFIKFPSWQSILYSSGQPPIWTLIAQWVFVASLFYLAYDTQHKIKN